eukprot:9134553-Alexandrium_andersonii.AAC.1
MGRAGPEQLRPARAEAFPPGPIRPNLCNPDWLNTASTSATTKRHRHHNESTTGLVHMATACTASCPAQQSIATEESQSNGSKARPNKRKKSIPISDPYSKTRCGCEPKQPTPRAEFLRLCIYGMRFCSDALFHPGRPQGSFGGGSRRAGTLSFKPGGVVQARPIPASP